MLKTTLPNIQRTILVLPSGVISTLFVVVEAPLLQELKVKPLFLYGFYQRCVAHYRCWKYLENISDGFFGGSVGSIAVSEWDNNVIYVENGEKTVRGNVSSGDGVWKTVNAGKTWEHVGLKNARHIPRIRVHPKNPDIVYAGVLGDLYKSSEERGVYKSTDGGKTWTKKLFANKNAGVVDLIIDPNNPRILYATTWNVRRTPYSLSSGGEGSALWKSTDEGETWMNISTNKGLPSGIWGISGVAVSPVNSDIVYALIENKKEEFINLLMLEKHGA